MTFVLRLLIGGLLWMVPGDDRRADAVESIVLAGRHRAQATFHHYRHGQGRPFPVSTSQLLHDDAGLRHALLWQLHDGRRGRIRVGQRLAAHHDWRLALGSICFDCRDVDAGVEVTAVGSYGWHPDQRRITQPIHRLAARLKDRGARPFPLVGDAATLAHDQIAEASTLPEPTVRAALLL